MRYFLLGVAALWALPVLGQNYNETVAAISYNPSRLGAYSHLKVVSNAKVSGIDALNADVNIMTTGTVEMKGPNTCSASDSPSCYKVDTVASMASESGCTNISDLCGDDNWAATLKTESNTIVEDKGSTYVAKSDLKDIKTSEEFPVNTGVNMDMYGGSLTSTSRTFVRKLVGDLSKVTLNAGSATLIMNAGQMMWVGKIGTTDGTFTLGNTTITAGSNSGSFMWQDRKDSDGTRATVLAFGS